LLDLNGNADLQGIEKNILCKFIWVNRVPRKVLGYGHLGKYRIQIGRNWLKR